MKLSFKALLGEEKKIKHFNKNNVKRKNKGIWII